MPDAKTTHIEKWLGRPTDAKWSNYYDLLGLPVHSENIQQIRETADSLFKRIKSHNPGPHSKSWKQLLRQVKAAHDCLTNPDLKAEYDAKLRREKNNSSTIKSNSGESKPSHLPPTPPTTNIQSPKSKEKSQNQPTRDPMKPVETFPAIAIPIAKPVAAPVPSQTSNRAPIVQAGLEHQNVRFRNRKKKKTFQTTLFSFVLLTVIGILGWLLYHTIGTQSASQNTDSIVARGRPDELKQEKTHGDPASSPTSNAETSSDPAERTNATSSTIDEENSPATTEEWPDPQLTIKEPIAVQLVSASELHPVSLQLIQFRTSLGDGDLEQALNCLAKASKLAEHPPIQDIISHANSLHQSVERYWKAVRSAMRNLDAGRSFELNEQVVLVVEGEEDYVILRTAGQNKRFEFEDMPFPLSMALVNLHQKESALRAKIKAAVLATSQGQPMNKIEPLLRLAERLDGNVQDIRAALEQDYDENALAELINSQND